jgi:FlaG/FlaF family flagellin (archaellin)
MGIGKTILTAIAIIAITVVFASIIAAFTFGNESSQSTSSGYTPEEWALFYDVDVHKSGDYIYANYYIYNAGDKATDYRHLEYPILVTHYTSYGEYDSVSTPYSYSNFTFYDGTQSDILLANETAMITARYVSSSYDTTKAQAALLPYNNNNIDITFNPVIGVLYLEDVDEYVAANTPEPEPEEKAHVIIRH